MSGLTMSPHFRAGKHRRASRTSLSRRHSLESEQPQEIDLLVSAWGRPGHESHQGGYSLLSGTGTATRRADELVAAGAIAWPNPRRKSASSNFLLTDWITRSSRPRTNHLGTERRMQSLQRGQHYVEFARRHLSRRAARNKCRRLRGTRR